MLRTGTCFSLIFGSEFILINQVKMCQTHFICSPLATNRGSLNKDPGYNGSIASSVTSPLLVNSLISCSSTINVTSDDTDENKYKRRSALTWFARYVCTRHSEATGSCIYYKIFFWI